MQDWVICNISFVFELLLLKKKGKKREKKREKKGKKKGKKREKKGKECCKIDRTCVGFASYREEVQLCFQLNQTQSNFHVDFYQVFVDGKASWSVLAMCELKGNKEVSQSERGIRF